MASVPWKQSVTFRDSKNQTATVSWWTVYDTTTSRDIIGADADAKVAALAALSNCVIASSHGAHNAEPGPVVSGANAVYENVEDKAVFTFQTAAGEIHRYQVPAPKTAIFQADGETVDFSNALVKLFVADWTNTTFSGTAPDASNLLAVSSRGGLVLTVSNGGSRRRVKIERKFNTFTRNPALTGQGL